MSHGAMSSVCSDIASSLLVVIVAVLVIAVVSWLSLLLVVVPLSEKQMADMGQTFMLWRRCQMIPVL